MINIKEEKYYFYNDLEEYKGSIEGENVKKSFASGKEMKKLMAWNRCYGCLPFEIFIAMGETIEDKKKYYKKMGYYCWIEEKKEVLTY